MFKFSLQRVLDLRSKREQEAATSLAAARDEAEQAREGCEALERARTDGVERIAAAAGGRVTAGQLQNLGLVIQSLDRQLVSARREMEQADAQVVRRMADFTSASQDRRVLDRLRDKHLQVWQADEMQQDRKVMDSIALTRYVRTQASTSEIPE